MSPEADTPLDPASASPLEESSPRGGTQLDDLTVFPLDSFTSSSLTPETPRSNVRGAVSKAEQQEQTRSRLALGIAVGIGILMYLILGLDLLHRNRLYRTFDGLINQGLYTPETLDKLLELKKEQAQASNALMTLLITANFSALGTALGFYFGSSNREG